MFNEFNEAISVRAGLQNAAKPLGFCSAWVAAPGPIVQLVSRARAQQLHVVAAAGGLLLAPGALHKLGVGQGDAREGVGASLDIA